MLGCPSTALPAANCHSVEEATAGRLLAWLVPVGSVGVSVGSGVGSPDPSDVPQTWSSATCAFAAPVLPVKARRTSATSAETGIATLLPVAGSNA
ncbi:hypothetical protein D3C74_360310 [compost metagenome]